MGSAGMRNTNGPGAADRDFGTDRASDRRVASTRSMANSNGLNAVDRDRGRDRAADRAHRHHRNHRHMH